MQQSPANNIVNALFMVGGAGAAAALLGGGLSIPALFGVAALGNAVVAIYIYRLVPEFLLRFVVWLLARLLFRLERQGAEHVPEAGAALIVCPHTSYADVLALTAYCSRPIRFVIDQRFFALPVIGFILRQGRAIPLAAQARATTPDASTRAAIAAALAAGELVAVFPETDEAATAIPADRSPFPSWIDALLADVAAISAIPAIPVTLNSLQDGPFARHSISLGARLLRFRPWQAVSVAAGHPATEVRQDRQGS